MVSMEYLCFDKRILFINQCGVWLMCSITRVLVINLCRHACKYEPEQSQRQSTQDGGQTKGKLKTRVDLRRLGSPFGQVFTTIIRTKIHVTKLEH